MSLLKLESVWRVKGLDVDNVQKRLFVYVQVYIK